MLPAVAGMSWTPRATLAICSSVRAASRAPKLADVETVTLEVNVCAAVQVLVELKSVEAGETTHWGAAPEPWLARR